MNHKCASAYCATAGGAICAESAAQDGIQLCSVSLVGSANPWKCKTLILIAASSAPGLATEETSSAGAKCAALLKV